MSDSISDGLKGNLDVIKSALYKERLFGLFALPIMTIIGLTFNAFRRG